MRALRTASSPCCESPRISPSPLTRTARAVASGFLATLHRSPGASKHSAASVLKASRNGSRKSSPTRRRFLRLPMPKPMSAAFIDDHNHNADHAIDDLSDNGVKISPNRRIYANWCGTRRVMADPAALDLLLAHWSKPLTVGRNGISLTIGGRTLHYGHVTKAPPSVQIARPKGETDCLYILRSERAWRPCGFTIRNCDS